MTNKITVKFEKRYNNNNGWDDEDNVSPYISVKNPEEDIKEQRFPNEIVIPMKKIRVTYNYPLSNKVTFKAAKEGFSTAEVARKVCEDYHRIYKEEETAVGNPGNIPGMLNRVSSSGPYGIWGHDIGDLLLRTVTQVDDNLFSLGVDS